ASRPGQRRSRTASIGMADPRPTARCGSEARLLLLVVGGEPSHRRPDPSLLARREVAAGDVDVSLRQPGCNAAARSPNRDTPSAAAGTPRTSRSATVPTTRSASKPANRLRVAASAPDPALRRLALGL